MAAPIYQHNMLQMSYVGVKLFSFDSEEDAGRVFTSVLESPITIVSLSPAKKIKLHLHSPSQEPSQSDEPIANSIALKLLRTPPLFSILFIVIIIGKREMTVSRKMQ
jgi:hypothetical protein